MCGSSPATITEPSQPAARTAWAARRPASPAPAMTSGRISVDDPDGQHRAGVRGLLGQLALGGVDVLAPAQDVVVAELEDVRRDVDALAVALAQVHIDVDFGHRAALSCTWRSASSSGIASATCRVWAEVSG